VIATGLSLVAYTVFPAAPPRLAGLGFVDTVTAHTHVNLSSDLLGSLYNPFAAVPSMHFGYALLVGIVLATTASNRSVRLVGALYPPFMLFDIVATGNHFVFDAAAGGLVTVVSLWAAARIERA
jgi:PAP2 superfamily